MVLRARAFASEMSRRRSVREFSRETFPMEVVDDAIRAAASAPSGAHQQPWTFVVVTSASLKQRIREAAEAEEKTNWEGRMGAEWMAAVEPFGLDWNKPHLTDAPVLIVVFAHAWGLAGSSGQSSPSAERVKHYYVSESVGIAVGFLLSSLHLAGLATLTHTPSPMAFLRTLLGRPANERAFAVIPVGYPRADAEVPCLERKPLDEVRVIV
ncbi:MAG: nitroreductase family protein [Myxococcales bacterium]|nr:nitroreductase family protein [Myxococcales bacterium]